MIGDMFNQGLKHRVDTLCKELADFLSSQPIANNEARGLQSQSQSGVGVSLFVAGTGSASRWWPAELGNPASTGAQNDLRYAFFPGPRRLAIQKGGEVRVYDTGEHRISGFSQEQAGDQSLTFISQYGLVRVADLLLMFPQGDQFPHHSPLGSASPPQMSGSLPPAAAPTTAPTPAAPLAMEDIMKTIERLAELCQKNILTEEEFVAKKVELLGRL